MVHSHRKKVYVKKVVYIMLYVNKKNITMQVGKVEQHYIHTACYTHQKFLYFVMMI
eukprot:UN26045